jgi:hypothetical protein
LRETTVLCLRALIALGLGSGNRKPLDLSAGYLLELGLPAFNWPGNEQ